MKVLNIIAGIIAIITIIGDIFFMLALASIGEATTAFTELGLETAEIAELQQTISFALTLGWLWAIVVLIGSLFLIKFALFDSRNKK